MRDITLKNMDGWTNYLETFKNFLIFDSSRKDKVLHFFGHIFIFL